MKISDNEVVIDSRMRRAEKQNQSPVNRLLEGAESAAGAVSIATGSVTIGCIARAFGIAKRITSGLGVATLEENLEHLADAAEAALSRVEKNLDAQGVRIEEIERRLHSDELLEGIKTATLQAQRTKDKKRLERMALILANGVAENNLEPESLDDMMRAAVELKDSDIALLGKICKSQGPLLREKGLTPTNWFGQVPWYWDQFIESEAIDPSMHLVYRSSLSRLESHGLIQKFREISTASVGLEHYALLKEGLEFFERLQEIGTSR